MGSSESDAIKARTLNLTLGSGFAAFVATAVIVFNDSFKAIFGETLAPDDLARYKVTILVAVIAAFALIAFGDLVSRAWTTSTTGHFVIAAAPSGLKATKTQGADASGFTVGAIRFRPNEPDAAEYLLVKANTEPEWVPVKHLTAS